jgi:hypothetical protein
MSNSTQMLDNPIILDIAPSYGAMLVGIFFASILYGISSLQAYVKAPSVLGVNLLSTPQVHLLHEVGSIQSFE